MPPSHLAKAAILLGRLARLPLVNPRGLREVFGVAFGASEQVMDPETDVLPIPAVTLQELANESGPVALHIYAYPQETFSITIVEAIGLSALIQRTQAKRIFEFGTHRGVSTTQLAANLPAGGEVFTLDLPRTDRTTKFDLENEAEHTVSRFAQKTDLIPDELRGRIHFLESDSALFDPEPYRESMDFVFVDAAHTADYMRNDTEKAWIMVRPGGIVVWHDCRPQTPDVVKYLRNCSLPVRRIAGTTLAFASKPVTP